MGSTDKLIVQALKAWLHWVSMGAPDGHRSFTRNRGLCSCVAFHVNRRYRGMFRRVTHRMIKGVFGVAYPFGRTTFHECCDHHTMHLDTNRIAWVRWCLAFVETHGRLPAMAETDEFIKSLGV